MPIFQFRMHCGAPHEGHVHRYKTSLLLLQAFRYRGGKWKCVEKVVLVWFGLVWLFQTSHSCRAGMTSFGYSNNIKMSGERIMWPKSASKRSKRHWSLRPWRKKSLHNAYEFDARSCSRLVSIRESCHREHSLRNIIPPVPSNEYMQSKARHRSQPASSFTQLSSSSSDLHSRWHCLLLLLCYLAPPDSPGHCSRAHYFPRSQPFRHHRRSAP